METGLKISPVNYPRKIADNVNYRAELIMACGKDDALRDEVYLMCKHNLIFWIDLFCWTKDPRRSPDILPFICYKSFQEEYLREIERAIDLQYDCLTEKTRDMGVSWGVLYVMKHKWLFEDGSDFRVGSRKEEFVDRPNDIDTLFEKVRFNIGRQPMFLMPPGFDWGKHSNYMKFINPFNGNAIVGESANEDFGSGGRRKAILLDEFAKWDDKIAEAAWTATADVSRCRLPVSTPKGSGNKFAMLAKGTKEKIKVLTVHWTLHPDKAKGAYYLDRDTRIPLDTPQKAFAKWLQLRGKIAPAPLKGGLVRSPWYDGEAIRSKDADLAQEKDIDYHRSGFPFFDLLALSKQKVWEYVMRQRPEDQIPWGKFIRVKLVELDHKIELRELPEGWLKIFELPNKEHQYVVSADTAEGLVKGDESFGVVRDKWTRNVVATFNGSYKTDDFSLKIKQAAQLYNKCLAVPENNNHGHSVCQDLKVMDCNLYHTTKISADGKESVTKAGFTTTAQSRPLMLDQAEEEIRLNAVEVRDPDIITQGTTFVCNEKTGKPEADGNFLDDGVIAFAIGGQVIKEQPYKGKSTTHTKQKQEAHRRRVRKNAGFGFKK